MAQIDRAVDLRKKMLNQEMKKEKELEKRVNCASPFNWGVQSQMVFYV